MASHAAVRGPTSRKAATGNVIVRLDTDGDGHSDFALNGAGVHHLTRDDLVS